jgi:hypothetical protein
MWSYSYFRNRVQQFVASKADLIFKLKGKERLQSGIDYNVDGPQEGMVDPTSFPGSERIKTLGTRLWWTLVVILIDC